MTAQPFDPVQYKASQKESWSQVAAGWKKWWPTMEASAKPASERLVELAQIRPGHHVLDVATISSSRRRPGSSFLFAMPCTERDRTVVRS
ncbi:MAG: hypothetical protein ACKOCD_05990 [Nitrospiraceae bacterium]